MSQRADKQRIEMRVLRYVLLLHPEIPESRDSSMRDSFRARHGLNGFP
jgi:hypothetical protein